MRVWYQFFVLQLSNARGFGNCRSGASWLWQLLDLGAASSWCCWIWELLALAADFANSFISSLSCKKSASFLTFSCTFLQFSRIFYCLAKDFGNSFAVIWITAVFCRISVDFCCFLAKSCHPFCKKRPISLHLQKQSPVSHFFIYERCHIFFHLNGVAFFHLAICSRSEYNPVFDSFSKFYVP